MLGSEGAGFLAIILLLRPQLPQPNFLPLRNRGLCDEAAKDNPAGLIQPVAGKRIDDLTPDPLLEGIEIYRRLRTTPTRDAGHNGEFSSGFTGHLKRPLDIVARPPQTLAFAIGSEGARAHPRVSIFQERLLPRGGSHNGPSVLWQRA
jgi:hypothetical protein